MLRGGGIFPGSRLSSTSLLRLLVILSSHLSCYFAKNVFRILEINFNVVGQNIDLSQNGFNIG